MRWGLVLFAVLVLAAPASAAAPSLQRQINALTRQTASMRAQIVQLQTQVVVLQQKDNKQDDLAICEHGLDADTINFVWHQVTALYQRLFGGDQVADLPHYDDKGACARAGVERPR